MKFLLESCMELQLPRRGRGRLGKPLSSRRLGLARHRPAVIAGGGAGAADFLGHGVEREALGAGDGSLYYYPSKPTLNRVPRHRDL